MTFDLTEAEATLVLQALGDQPFRVSAGLIGKLQSQAQPQVKKPEPVEAEQDNG